VLVLFTFIFLRALRIAARAPNLFGYMLAIGIGLTLFGCAVVNMAMTVGLVPTAGLPLPFVSYGGSSLVVSLAAVGVLMNISSQGQGSQAGAPLRPKSIRARTRVYARRARGAAPARGCGSC